MPKPKKFYTGGLELTADEALEFTLHHLALAGLFYMTATEDHAVALAECERMLGRGTLGLNDPSYLAALAFLEASHAAHTTARHKDAL